MTKSTVGQWSTAAASNTDVGGIGLSDSMVPTSLDDAYREMMAQIRVDLYGAEAFSGHLYGLTLSNGSDATNDIDIASGICIDGTNARWLKNASTLTKRSDAAWAVGTGNGGWLDGSAMPDGTGHVFAMLRSDTGVVDAGLSASLTPTLPSGYDYKRRIGAIVRSGGSIKAFTQRGDNFYWTTAVTDRSSTSNSVSDSDLALTVPSGIVVNPIIRIRQTQSTAGFIDTTYSSNSGSAAVPPVCHLITVDANEEAHNLLSALFTNTSAQIRVSVTNSGGTLLLGELYTQGWIDTRGRLA